MESDRKLLLFCTTSVKATKSFCAWRQALLLLFSHHLFAWLLKRKVEKTQEENMNESGSNQGGPGICPLSSP